LTNDATVEARVRSYLDSNCSQCHRPGGVQAFWDARFDTPLANQNIINGSVANALAGPGSKVVAPQDLARSGAYFRLDGVGASQMPPLARNRIDVAAVALFVDWIKNLPQSSTALPLPWVDEDVGRVTQPGDASYTGGTFTLSASGDDIWDTADAFHFV